MSFYKITLSKKGKKETIIIEAESKLQAIEQAKKQHKYKIVIKAEEISPPIEYQIKQFINQFKTKLTTKLNLSAFVSAIRQLSALTLAQISINESLENISQNTKDRLIKEMFHKAADGVDSGLSLSQVFEDYKNYIGNLAIALIKLGEQTGKLGESLNTLADIYEEMEDNKQKLKKAMRMPMITLFIMGIAFTILISFVVPKFKTIFAQLHTELPLPTKILLYLENIINNYGIFIILILLGAFALNKYYYATNKEYKYKIDKLILKTPIIKDLVENSSISRFLLVLTELTRAGIPLITSLNIANDIIENSVLKSQIDKIIQDINQGHSLSESLNKHQILDNITLQMVTAGEKAGNLEDMLENASHYYKNKFQNTIDGLHDAIEPIMIAIIGVLVLILALGIFLPMWNMASAVKN